MSKINYLKTYNRPYMNDLNFISEYYEKYKKAIFGVDVTEELIQTKQLFLAANKSGNQLVFAGNGASASIASHAALDFTKQGKVKSMSFNDDALITAFANDYGYENWVGKAIEHYCTAGDVAVLISSSGTSKNIVNAAQTAKLQGLKVVTFSGFKASNPLKQIGDVNFWVESEAYNIIESTHQIWLLTVVDMIIGKAEYSVTN